MLRFGVKAAWLVALLSLLWNVFVSLLGSSLGFGLVSTVALLGWCQLAALLMLVNQGSPRHSESELLKQGLLVRCPACRETVRRDAIKCMHCHTALGS